MGKIAKTGNIAVAGIHSTSTTKPTTSTITTTTGTTKSTGSTSSGTKASTTKSYSSGSSGSSGSSKSTGSSGTSEASAATAAAATTPSIGSQIYSTYSDGVSGNNAYNQAAAANTTAQIVNKAKNSVNANANVQKVKNVDTAKQEKQLKELSDLQKQQALNQIDYATNTGITELQRNYEDALPEYQTQRDQAAIQGQQALDNQTLYAAKHGDNGGIGQSQYNSVQNNTANAIQSVNSAQVKLLTDTGRQIADLQSKGEYEKADKVLEISQDYTEKLMDLEKWATEQNVDIDEFNAKIDEWKAEYQLKVSQYLTDTELAAANATGAFSNGTNTADMANSINDRYASSGKSMISAGIVPSDEQLSAMGWTPQQYWVYKMSQASAAQ